MMLRSAVSAIALATVLSAPAHADNLVLSRQGGNTTSLFVNQQGGTGTSGANFEQFAKETARAEVTQEDGHTWTGGKQFGDTTIGIVDSESQNETKVDLRQKAGKLAGTDVTQVGLDTVLTSDQTSDGDAQIFVEQRGAPVTSNAAEIKQVAKGNASLDVTQTGNWNETTSSQISALRSQAVTKQTGNAGNYWDNYQTGTVSAAKGTQKSGWNKIDTTQWSSDQSYFESLQSQ